MRPTLTVLFVVFFGATVFAQRFCVNVDFHDGAGTPQQSFSAAGSTGYWNTVGSDLGDSTGIRDTSGAMTTLSISSSRSLFPVTWGNASLEGDSAALLEDYLCSHLNDFVLTISGLSNLVYKLIVYTAPTPYATTVTINGDFNSSAVMTGNWPGYFEQGSTHTLHYVQVTNGTIRVALQKDADAFINGFQLTETFTMPPLIAVTDNLGVLNLTVLDTEPDCVYTLQARGSLISGIWTNVGTKVGQPDRSIIQWPCGSGSPRMFYRVLVTQQ
jgi:hypothetical protein